MKKASTDTRSILSAGDDSDALAASLLSFLSAEPSRFERFLATTGLTPRTLRTAAADESFAPALLDYVAGDEPLLLAYAAETGRNPASLMAERGRLSRHAGEP